MGSLLEIGVVGGGASAVCLLDALSRRPDLPTGSVTVFEPSPHLWRGRPYQPDLDVVRVNATPDDMSVHGGDNGHFQEWLTARDLVVGSAETYTDPLSGARFVPRATFGDYLEQSARAALLALVAKGWQVTLVREKVDRTTPAQGGMLLRTTSGALYTVDYAVLCVGAGQPSDTYTLTGAPGFISEPYPVRKSLAAVDPTDEVAVIGSGLTAVDIVLALNALGHTGRIRLFSRRGVLPGVRQRPAHHALSHFTPARFRAMAARGESVTLDGLIKVMNAELVAAGEDPDAIRREIASVRDEEPVARLRRQLAEVDSPSVGMRILQQAVPDAGPDVWPLLSEDDKVLLLAEHYRTLMSLCCPMPPSSAATLLSLIDSGRLELVHGVRHVEAVDGGFHISTAHGDYEAKTLVNAVNARLRTISEKAAPMIQSLVMAGLAEPHPRGGVHVERATSRLTVGAHPDARLYALGDPAAGSLFFTFGVQSLVDRAVDIVDAIHDDASARLGVPFGGDALQPA
ncbi:MAG: FAD/NAD(P)-binding protein [Actinomycetota bacterium]|nr:FAD/NAD(P)-binding protein [Actinomycetota bacterium]